jgi:hypothetical protein
LRLAAQITTIEVRTYPPQVCSTRTQSSTIEWGRGVVSLQQIISQIVSDSPGHAATRAYVTLVLRIAAAALRSRGRTWFLTAGFPGMSIDDVAVDCVAALFQRGEKGEYPGLRKFYDQLSWTDLSEQELLMHTRRLVCSRVNQEFSRILKDVDPSLEKLRRNIRLAARRNASITEGMRSGVLWLFTPSELASPRHLPEMPWEFLEASLASRIHGSAGVHAVIDAVAEVFEEQDVYAGGFPLTQLAIVVRNFFARQDGRQEFAEEPSAVRELDEEDMRSLIRESVEMVAGERRAMYTEKRRIPAATYDAYIKTAQEVLFLEFSMGQSELNSYHEIFSRHLPGVSYDCYRSVHRGYLEYLVKLIRASFLSKAAQEW